MIQGPPFKTCPKNSPKLAECLIKAVEAMNPQISTGIYGPLRTANLTRISIGDIAVNRNINVKLNGLHLIGMNNFKIDKLRINPEKFKVNKILVYLDDDIYANKIFVYNLVRSVNLNTSYGWICKVSIRMEFGHFPNSGCWR